MCILGAPVFKIRPRKQVIKVNQPMVIFDCVADGNPRPHISWYFNDDRMLLSERHSIRSNGSIVITNIALSDAGSYSCHAENIHGRTVASADLEVTGQIINF